LVVKIQGGLHKQMQRVQWPADASIHVDAAQLREISVPGLLA
jgi:hypothetical protein